jgi:hypothetical protein
MWSSSHPFALASAGAFGPSSRSTRAATAPAGQSRARHSSSGAHPRVGIRTATFGHAQPWLCAAHPHSSFSPQCLHRASRNLGSSRSILPRRGAAATGQLPLISSLNPD